MRKITIVGTGLCAVLLAGAAAGCSSSSTTTTTNDSGTGDSGVTDTGTKPDSSPPKKDSGTKDATPKPDAKDAGQDSESDATIEAGEDAGDAAFDTGSDAGEGGAVDGGSDVSIIDGGSGVTYLAIAYSGVGVGETPASTGLLVNLATNAIAQTFHSTDGQLLLDTSNSLSPFAIEQTNSVVTRLDPTTATTDGSWSVALGADASPNDYADPYAISVGTANQGYVVRNESNTIDVLNLAVDPDGGAPASGIDLAALVQSADKDGHVDAAASVYVAATHTLYVALENVDIPAVDDYMGTFYSLCVGTQSTIVGIDTTTNTVLNLGNGPGGSIVLQGFDPIQGGLSFDAANNRLLVLEAGCNPAPTVDGGAPGAVQQRGVEAVDLGTNTTKVLLDASSEPYPGQLAYLDGTHAVVSFVDYSSGFGVVTAYQWDPTTTALGAVIPNAPDLFAADGHGNLVGAVIYTPADAGGVATTDIVSTVIATGVRTTLVPNALVPNEGYLSSVGIWTQK